MTNLEKILEILKKAFRKFFEKILIKSGKKYWNVREFLEKIW